MEQPLLSKRPSTMADTAPLETAEHAEETSSATLWHVILYNDDVHTFDEVIDQLMLATSCTLDRAEQLTWKVHTQGKATVFEEEFEPCFRAQEILRQIELITELRG
jgi:ATP-dependent Clp protease adapter protein ClpS